MKSVRKILRIVLLAIVVLIVCIVVVIHFFGNSILVHLIQLNVIRY